MKVLISLESGAYVITEGQEVVIEGDSGFVVHPGILNPHTFTVTDVYTGYSVVSGAPGEDMRCIVEYAVDAIEATGGIESYRVERAQVTGAAS